MESIKDVMASNGQLKPQEKVINTFVCDGCQENVTRKEMIIPIGPRKGETIVADYGCKCADYEFVRKSREKGKQFKADKMKRAFDHYSLINPSLQKATMESYQPTCDELGQAKKQAQQFINEFDGTKNMLFVGNYGTGKSHLSVAITKELMEQGKQCLFLSLPKLLTKIKETYNNNGVSEDELLEVIQNVDLLVLDDLGAENTTEWSTAKLFEILDDRAGKSTIYTTNLNSNDLRERMNERNFSRLMENLEIVKMNGKDYRRKVF